MSAKSQVFGGSTGSTPGILLTGGAANTKGTYVSLGTTSFEWRWVNINLVQFSSFVDFNMDLAVDDGAGNRHVIAANLHCAFNTNGAGNTDYCLPLRVASGKALYARVASTSASATAYVAVRGFSAGSMGGPGYNQCVAVHPGTNSRGVAIDPGGTAHTKSAWVSVGTGPASHVGALLVGVGTNGLAARAVLTWLLDIGVGGSGTQRVLLSNICLGCDQTSDALWPKVFGPVPCDLPPSTAFWARGQCSATTAGQRAFDISLYAMA
jgi:hypothetical protein